MPRDITLLDNEDTYGTNADGLFVRHDQLITQDFLDDLHSMRLAQAAIRCKDFHAVATVPECVIDVWQKQGLDFYKMSPTEIVNRLRKDDLHAFIATPKRV